MNTLYTVRMIYTVCVQGHSSPVTAVASGSSDQVVLSAGQDKTLLLHSLSSSHSPQNTVTLSGKDTAEQVYTQYSRTSDNRHAKDKLL